MPLSLQQIPTNPLTLSSRAPSTLLVHNAYTFRLRKYARSKPGTLALSQNKGIMSVPSRPVNRDGYGPSGTTCVPSVSQLDTHAYLHYNRVRHVTPFLDMSKDTVEAL